MFMTKTIFSNLLKKYSTRLHPGEQRILPAGFRGRFKFAIDKCILCRSCVIKCPTKVIRIDPEIGLWEREVMGCLYCGVCADVCPTGCITMTNVYRPPITEPAFLRFNVKPRPSKKKAAAGEMPTEKEIQTAIENKMADEAKEGKTGVGKVETLEEDAVMPASEARAAEQATPARADAGQAKKKKK